MKEAGCKRQLRQHGSEPCFVLSSAEKTMLDKCSTRSMVSSSGVATQRITSGESAVGAGGVVVIVKVTVGAVDSELGAGPEIL